MINLSILRICVGWWLIVMAILGVYCFYFTIKEIIKDFDGTVKTVLLDAVIGLTLFVICACAWSFIELIFIGLGKLIVLLFEACI